MGDRLLQADGVGGAIVNAGTLNVDESTFRNCSASLQGGAVYTSGNAVLQNSNFVNNSAQAGGAVYAVNSNVLKAQSNTFIGNTASVESDDIGSAAGAQVTVCGNTGVADTPDCEGSTSDARALSPIHQVATTSLALALLFCTLC